MTTTTAGNGKAGGRQGGKGDAGNGAGGGAVTSAATVATPWGGATLVAQATVQQRAGARRFHSAVQLLADERGEPLVRFAYATAGRARRGPVTLRARDLERLRTAAAREPALAALLGWGGGEGRAGG